MNNLIHNIESKNIVFKGEWLDKQEEEHSKS